jgi:hypothetical protein
MCPPSLERRHEVLSTTETKRMETLTPSRFCYHGDARKTYRVRYVQSVIKTPEVVIARLFIVRNRRRDETTKGFHLASLDG